MSSGLTVRRHWISYKSAGYVLKPKTYPACKKCSLGKPQGWSGAADGHLYYRCCRNTCRKCFNVLKFSKFAKARVTPAELGVIVHRYVSLDRMAPPPIDDIAADVELGRTKVTRVVQVLRSVEFKVAQHQNTRGQLAGDLEVDEHAPRSFHVSTKNEKFKRYVRKILLKKKHPYYLNYWRIIGLRKRGGGRVYIRFLPPKPLPLGSSPPPLSEDELIESKILKRARPRSSVCHSDGAQSYPAVIKKYFKKLRSRAVAHKRMEFVKPIKPPQLRRGAASSHSGTQCIDSTWKTLDAAIPQQVKTKKDHDVNPLLKDYAHVWLYRVNHRNLDGFETLGGYIRKGF